MLSRSILSLSEPMDYSSPGSSVYRINLARILEWVAISSSRGSSNPGIKPRSPVLAGGFFTTEPPGKPLNVEQIVGKCLSWLRWQKQDWVLCTGQADRKREKEQGSWVSPVPETPNGASHGVGGDRVKVLAGRRQSAVPKGCCEVYNAVPSFMENKWLVSYHFIISSAHIRVRAYVWQVLVSMIFSQILYFLMLSFLKNFLFCIGV